jgi:hypothetical protein
VLEFCSAIASRPQAIFSTTKLQPTAQRSTFSLDFMPVFVFVYCVSWGKKCDRRTWRFGLPRDLAPGAAGAQWGNLGIAHVGARADRGDADMRVSAEEATEPHSQRKANAARSKTQSPPRTVVSHAQRFGKSASGCGQFSKCCKTKQALTGLRLQPRGP